MIYRRLWRFKTPLRDGNFTIVFTVATVTLQQFIYLQKKKDGTFNEFISLRTDFYFHKLLSPTIQLQIKSSVTVTISQFFTVTTDTHYFTGTAGTLTSTHIVVLPLVSLWFFFSANKINDAHFYVHRFTIEKNILYNITVGKLKKRTVFKIQHLLNKVI